MYSFILITLRFMETSIRLGNNKGIKFLILYTFNMIISEKFILFNVSSNDGVVNVNAFVAEDFIDNFVIDFALDVLIFRAVVVVVTETFRGDCSL